MDDDKLIENVHACVVALEDVFGKSYMQIIDGLHLAPTMGPSVKIEYAKPE